MHVILIHVFMLGMLTWIVTNETLIFFSLLCDQQRCVSSDYVFCFPACQRTLHLIAENE